MKKLLLVAALFLLLPALYAQHLLFKVQDSKTGEGISAVKISSIEEHTFLTFSSDSGYFSLDIDHDDTLKIEKADYHPIYLNVKHNNFDTSHVIVVNIVQVEKDSTASNTASDIKSLEYHFLHDNIEGNNLKVHVFDGYQPPNTTQQNASFKIAKVPLGHVHVEHKSEVHTENLYNPVAK